MQNVRLNEPAVGIGEAVRCHERMRVKVVDYLSHASDLQSRHNAVQDRLFGLRDACAADAASTAENRHAPAKVLDDRPLYLVSTRRNDRDRRIFSTP